MGFVDSKRILNMQPEGTTPIPLGRIIDKPDPFSEKPSMGVVRTTYLIDESGIIIFANDKVKAADDAEKMLSQI